MKYKESLVPITKQELNRLKMRVYRSHGMSKGQKEKIKEYDRKRAEAKWLKKKIGKEIERENNHSRKHSSRAKLKIPTYPTKYAKHVKGCEISRERFSKIKHTD